MLRRFSFRSLAALGLALLAAGCGLPSRNAVLIERHGYLPQIPGFEDVRAVNGYQSEIFQKSFDEVIARFSTSDLPSDGRRDFDMLVLSSGGVNGSFGAGILQGWTCRGDRPDFEVVTGVSVGSLLAPFAFAGSEYDMRLEELFRRLNPEDLHTENGALSGVLWGESLMDNSPLKALIRRGIDEQLLNAVADGHEAGRRLYVGSTNLDVGDFVIWDMGAIASRRNEAALELFRQVLTASASIPVVYPPVRFQQADGGLDELHVDGAVVHSLFLPEGVFDGYLSAERAGMSWDDVDASLYVVNNGSLRPLPTEVARDTFDIALRSITMMSYTMVGDDVLHLYLLARLWGASFNFLAVPDGVELSVADFNAKATENLFLLGRGTMEQETPWCSTPPGYIAGGDLSRIQPISGIQKLEVGEERTSFDGSAATVGPRLQQMELMLTEIQAELRALRSERNGGPR